jgi:sugar lactone lactonase YvrE
MFKGLKLLPQWQRRLIFIAIFGGGIVALVACTLFLITQTLFVSRSAAVALIPEVSVREYAALPDDNAYPPTIAASADGTLYTGSFASGAVWQISPDGSISEIPNTRNQIGGVSGIAIAPDGALLITDNGDTDPRTQGGAVWRVTPTGDIRAFARINDAGGFVAPDDVAVDGSGAVYITDRGRNEVWRFNANGSEGRLWWVPPVGETAQRRGITGIAYDPTRDAMIIADAEINELYRVAITGGATETLYRHGNREFPPGFDGITVTPDGIVYIAALGQNGIARLGDGELDYVAGLFRGASDVDYSQGRLYVTNFDQTSLVLPVRPALPFAIDVIEFITATPTAGG